MPWMRLTPREISMPATKTISIHFWRHEDPLPPELAFDSARDHHYKHHSDDEVPQIADAGGAFFAKRQGDHQKEHRQGAKHDAKDHLRAAELLVVHLGDERIEPAAILRLVLFQRGQFLIFEGDVRDRLLRLGRQVLLFQPGELHGGLLDRLRFRRGSGFFFRNGLRRFFLLLLRLRLFQLFAVVRVRQLRSLRSISHCLYHNMKSLWTQGVFTPRPCRARVPAPSPAAG